ncbi:MAG: pilin [Patescibacteria group bacterium]|nr:pilin [Patescibacteria group bacterium]MDD5715464.1 pilin [Patescibacteria group bacterium]
MRAEKKIKAGKFMGLIIAVVLVSAPLLASAQTWLTTFNPSCAITQTDVNDGSAIRVNIAIPNVTIDLATGDGTATGHYVKNMGCYIAGLYIYFMGVIGILATVMGMYGGVKYVISFGNPQKLSEAKDTITGALMGLLIGLGSYSILYFINPNLTILGTLDVGKIQQVEDFCEEYVSQGLVVDPPLPQETCGTEGTITSAGNLKGKRCYYKGTDCELKEQYCVRDPFTGIPRCTAQWEGMNFCMERIYQSCGFIWDKDGKDECQGVHSSDDEICIAMSNDAGKEIRAFKSWPIYYEGETSDAHVTRNEPCGYIAKGAWPTGKLVIGKECEGDKKSCLILFGGEEKYGYHIFTAEDMKPGDPDLLGAFQGARCY